MSDLSEFLARFQEHPVFDRYFGEIDGLDLQEALDEGSVESLLARDSDIRRSVLDVLDLFVARDEIARDAYEQFKGQIDSLTENSTPAAPRHVLARSSPPRNESVVSTEEITPVILSVITALGDTAAFAKKHGGSPESLHEFKQIITRAGVEGTISKAEIQKVLRILDEDILPKIEIERLRKEFDALRHAFLSLIQQDLGTTEIFPLDPSVDIDIDQINFAALEFVEISAGKYVSETDVLIHSTPYLLICQKVISGDGLLHEFSFELKSLTGQLLFHGSALMRSDSWQYVAKTRIDRDLPRKEEGEMAEEESELARHMNGMGVRLDRLLLEYLQDHANATGLSVFHVVDGPKQDELPRVVWLKIFGSLLEDYEHDPRADTWTKEYRPLALRPAHHTREEVSRSSAVIASEAIQLEQPREQTRSLRPNGPRDDNKDEPQALGGGIMTIGVGSQFDFSTAQEDVKFIIGNAEVFDDASAQYDLAVYDNQFAIRNLQFAVPDDWESTLIDTISLSEESGLTAVANHLELADDTEAFVLFTNQTDLYRNLIEAGYAGIASQLSQSEVTLTQAQIIQINAAIFANAPEEVVALVQTILPPEAFSPMGNTPTVLGPSTHGVMRSTSVLRVVR